VEVTRVLAHAVSMAGTGTRTRVVVEREMVPKPRTQEVVMMELEKKEAEITAMKLAEKSRGWNACLRTITKPVTSGFVSQCYNLLVRYDYN